jgi:spermidine synthase
MSPLTAGNTGNCRHFPSDSNYVYILNAFEKKYCRDSLRRRENSYSMNQIRNKGPLPWLLLMFFASGCAALIYEIVWLQLLELVIGSSGYSVAVLLGTFMGGMCLGSLLLPRLIPLRLHPLRVYACLEVGTGLLGMAVLFGMPYLADLYSVFHWHGVGSRALISAICLLPPTFLMGATLPAVSRFVESTPEGISWMGFFYGGNIAGGVVGCLGAGFFLLRLFDMPTAACAAAAINFAAAAIGIGLARKTAHVVLPSDANSGMRSQAGSRRMLVHITIAASGLSALGAEVVWTRLLSLLLGGTVYTFSIILAVFLAGLGIGSSIGSLLARRATNPRAVLGFFQMCLAGAIGWSAFIIARSLPYWPINPSIYTGDWGPWQLFQLDILRVGWAVLPATIFWGASFPLAVAGIASRGQDPGRMVGGIYAANTIGAIAGALAFSLFVIPRMGTQWAERLLIMTAAVSSLWALASAFSFGRRRAVAATENLSPHPSFRAVCAVLASMAGIVFLVISIAKIPWVVIAWGRFCATYVAQAYPDLIAAKARLPESGKTSQWYCSYVGEGINVSVAVTRTRAGNRFFHGAGKVQASSQPQDMRLQRMLGHLSVLSAGDPAKVSNVLVVACGAGVTAGSFVPYPDIKRITICDIEPLVPKFVTPMFGEENYHIADGIDRQNPHFVNGKLVSVIYDDGRHYISTLPGEEKFDVITSDPIDPWVKGSAALNTVEYYEMCKRHLKPGGVMTLWMPLYESNDDSAKSIIATFFQVFPNGMIFSNDQQFEGYDAVLLGRSEPARIDLDKVESLLSRKDYMAVLKSLSDVGFGSIGYTGEQQSTAVDLFSTFAGRSSDLVLWTKSGQINKDRNLRLQYLSGMWFNSYQGTKILDNILDHYRFPTDVFFGSEERLSTLKRALADRGRREKGSLLP